MGTHPIFESDFDCLTDKCKNRKMSSEEPSSGIDPSLIAAALGDISSDDEPVLPSKRRCRKRKSASPSPPVSPIHKSDSDDEGPSLADRYKERLANEIKKNLEKISNMEKEEDAQGKPVTKKLNRTRLLNLYINF